MIGSEDDDQFRIKDLDLGARLSQHRINLAIDLLTGIIDAAQRSVR